MQINPFLHAYVFGDAFLMYSTGQNSLEIPEIFFPLFCLINAFSSSISDPRYFFVPISTLV